jgi:VanZ family protein
MAHATGYALLALGYLHGLGGASRRVYLLAWLLAFLYAASDEFHQSFVPGRNGTMIDVGIDAFGAGMGLWLVSLVRKKRR